MKKHFLEILMGLAATAYMVLALTTTVSDYDMWGYLAFGREFWHGQGFLAKDVFSYVPTKPIWVFHEWLTGVLLFAVYQVFGDMGLQLWKYALGLATAGLALLASLKRGARPLESFLGLFVCAYFVFPATSPVRAQFFTYFFFVLSLLVLETVRKDRKWLRLLWLVPVNCLWANMHAGFMAGLGLIALYAVAEAAARRPFLPFAKALGGSAAATLINPYGALLWKSVLFHAAGPDPRIMEWDSVFTSYAEGVNVGQTIVFAMAVFAGLLFILRRFREDTAPALVLAVTACLGAAHIRHIILYALCFAVYLPLGFKEFAGDFRAGKRSVLHWAALIALACVAAAAVPLFWVDIQGARWRALAADRPADWLKLKTPSCNSPDQEPCYPVDALRFMKEQELKGNILPNYCWGSFLSWVLYPESLVAMDGRCETVYPEEIRQEYFDFLDGEMGGRAFLSRYPHDIILLRSHTRAHILLRHNPNWREVFVSPCSAVFIRARASEPADLRLFP